MASRRAEVLEDDDIMSYCGSISGETFSSRRRKNTCNLRQHSIDVLAQKLRDYTFDLEQQQQPSGQRTLEAKRFNTCFHKFRFLVVMFGGFSLGLMLLVRYNITVAILNMVNQTALYMHEHPDRTMDDYLAEGYTVSSGEFDWDNEIQHMIMSWYMVAYTLPQVPATKIGLMLGNKLMTPISLTVCALSTLLTPTLAYWGWEWVIALRLLNGIGGSAILPMMLNLIENWMPYDEISLGLSVAQVLQGLLTAANPLVVGYLSSIHWSYAFYVPAGVALVFAALWLLVITDRPEENWLISQQELDHICGCRPKSSAQGGGGDDSCKQVTATTTTVTTTTANKSAPRDDPKPTAMDVFRVPSFYAFLFMWCFYCSSYSGFTFFLPTYLRQFLKIKIAQNGLYCFIIQTGSILSVIWPHPFLRILEKRFNFSLTAARRTTYLVVCSMVALTWIYVGTFHDSQLPMLFLNRCFHGSNDIVVTGTLMSNYAAAGLSSMVFSMVNTVGNLSVVFSSTFIGWLLDLTGQSRQGWMFIYSGLGVSQLIMLLTFATLIRSGPIQFKSNKKKERDYSVGINPASNQAAATTPAIEDDHDTQIEVVCKKESSSNNFMNNFDKMKDSNHKHDQ